MKTVHILLIAIAFVSCDSSNKQSSSDSQTGEVVKGSCQYVRLLGAPIETLSSNQAPALGHVCTEGVFKDHESTKSWCNDVGKVFDKEGKLFKFTPNGSCDTETAVATCASTESGSQRSLIALYDTEPYDTSEAKTGLEDLCSHYGMVYKDFD